MLSKTSKYAIRAMIYIAKNTKPNEKIGLKKIAEELDIPSPFLGKILQTLAKRKLLLSTKGPNGGFSVNRNMGDITILKIIEIIDGLDFFNDCLLGLDCHDHLEDGRCPIHDKYEPIKDQLKQFFENQTIDELVEEIEKSENQIIV